MRYTMTPEERVGQCKSLPSLCAELNRIERDICILNSDKWWNECIQEKATIHDFIDIDFLPFYGSNTPPPIPQAIFYSWNSLGDVLLYENGEWKITYTEGLFKDEI